MIALPFKQVDVFTQKLFFGNPVAVVLAADKLATADMQRIAAWTNLSETTFVLSPSSSAADYRLRIFTPKRELPFAGHPTLGSAHAVLESGAAQARDGRLRQECLAGIIDLSVEQSAAGRRILCQTPRAKITALDDANGPAVAAALGVESPPQEPPLRIDVGVVWLIVNMGDAKTLAGLEPRMDQVLALSLATDAAGITCFGKAHDGSTQLHVRSFAPALGVAEDPVCGSGNACVAAYLIHTGLIRDFGSAYSARQGMQVGRDGQVAVTVHGDAIKVGGYAVTCVDGTLRVE